MRKKNYKGAKLKMNMGRDERKAVLILEIE